jgi:catalase (peroxidase I)
MAKKTRQPDGSVPRDPTMLQTVGALIAGLLAVKVASYAITTFWRLVLREDPPQIDQDVHWGKKAAWLALIGAATGAARQSVRDLIKPPTVGPA